MILSCSASSLAIGSAVFAAGKAMRMDEAVDVALIARTSQRHVAIGALRGLGGIVERARALSGDAAGLPVVVIVEAANPAIVIDRHIEMDLVAAGAELRRLVSHEGLQKHAAVRLGIQIDQKIVQQPRRPDSCWRPVRAARDIRDRNRPAPWCSSRWRSSGTSCSRVRPAPRADARSA